MKITNIQKKQIVTLILSLLLAIGSYWIPLPLRTPTWSPHLPDLPNRVVAG
jgi:hypothetical protein